MDPGFAQLIEAFGSGGRGEAPRKLCDEADDLARATRLDLSIGDRALEAIESSPQDGAQVSFVLAPIDAQNAFRVGVVVGHAGESTDRR